MALSTTFYQPASRFASSTPSAVTGVSWAAGDTIVVIGVTNNVTVTLDAPSNANLTFGAADTEQSSGSSESNIYLWKTTAGSSQSGQTININRSSGSGVFTGSVWVISGGPTGTANITSNRTESGFSATVSAGSVVIVSCVDWNAAAAGRTIATGSGTATERQDETDGTNYTIWSGDWGGVSAGTFTFGPTDYTGWKVAQAIIEITAGSGTVPDAPTSVVSSPDNTTARVSWTAPASDGGSPITDYVIEYAPGPGYSAWSTFSDGTSTNLFATVTGLTNGTSYKFRVKATNSVGDSAASTASSAVTPSAPAGGFTDYGYYTAQKWRGRSLLESGKLPWIGRNMGISAPAVVAAGAWGSLTGAATAAVTVPAVVAGSWGSLTGAVSALPSHDATVAGVWGALTGSASSVVSHPATTTGVWGGLSGSASSDVTHVVTTSGAWGSLSAASSASVSHDASTAGSWGALSGAVSSVVSHSAAVVAAWGSLAGSVTATPDVPAVADGQWGGLTGAATATGSSGATADGAWGSLTGSASPVVTHPVTVSGSWGGLTGAASASNSSEVTADGQWGGLTGAATAVVTHAATTTGVWGGLSGSVVSTPFVSAVVAAAWGALSGASTAVVAHDATTVGTWGGLSGAGSAVVQHVAEASGQWGSLQGSSLAFRTVDAVANSDFGGMLVSADAYVEVLAQAVANWGGLTGDAGQLPHTVGAYWGVLVG